MTLQEIFNKHNNLAQSSATGLSSLKEYLTSVHTKITKWMSLDDDSLDVITVAVTTKSNKDLKKMVDITRSDYQACVDDADGDDLILHTSDDDTEAFERAEVLSALEDIMSESSIQKEFVDYVMNHEQVSAVEFSTYLKTKFNAVTNNMVEKYGQYLVTGNPVHALRGYLSSVSLATATKDNSNSFISIASRNEFTGTSVWSIVWTNFKNKVSELFSDVWEDLLHIFNFFKNLFDKIIQLGKWLLSKFAKPFVTNYEKAGANFGVMDCPIFQFYIGDLNVSTEGNNSITPSETFSAVKSYGFLFHRDTQTTLTGGHAAIKGGQYNTQVYKVVPTANQNGSGATLDFDAMLDHWANCLVEYTDDGDALVRPFDVTIPLQDYVNKDYFPAAVDSFVLRLGVTDDLKVYLLMYASMPKSYYDQFYDREIAAGIQAGILGLTKMAEVCLPYYFDSNNEDFTVRVHGVAYTFTGGNFALTNVPIFNAFFTSLSNDEAKDSGPIDLVSHLPAFNFEDVVNDVTIPYPDDSNWTVAMVARRFMAMIILPLLFINSPDLAKTFNSDADIEKVIGLYKNGSDEAGNGFAWNAVPPCSINDIGLPANWRYSYRPYCNSGLIDFTLHYQTLNERAEELEKYIVGAIIAIAAIIVVVKVSKFIKARKIKAELASGYAENMSWNLPANPSETQVNNYLKARKKARIISRHNALLGIGSTFETSSGIVGTVQAVTDQLLALQGFSTQQDNNAPTLRDIRLIISGS